jgi:hypothetical protein
MCDPIDSGSFVRHARAAISIIALLAARFLPPHGARDEEQRSSDDLADGGALDADSFETGGANFLERNSIGESSIFIPGTVAESRIRGAKVTVRSPPMWSCAPAHLAYSNQIAQAVGVHGGLVTPGDRPAWSALDHDQCNTLNCGRDVNTPWQSYTAREVDDGPGFSNGAAAWTDLRCSLLPAGAPADRSGCR